jgi:HAD superfamily hydrolase (TIGR01509 family)
MKLIVWDFDGTLADSRPLIEAGMAHTLEALGHPPEVMDEWLKYVGLPVEAGIQATFGVTPGPDLDHILATYRTYPHAQNQHLIQPFDGMTALLRDLQARGIPMALATSKRRLPLSRQLAAFGWGTCFDPIITPDEVTHGKPHPESLELIMAETGLAPADLLMVGDTSFDLEMAQRAGVPSLALGHGFHCQELLAPWNPRAYAPDVAALRDILMAWI